MRVDLLGIKVDALTMDQVLDQIVFLINSDKKHQIITANAEIVLASFGNTRYQNLINQSSLVVADGIGLLWAAKFLSLQPNGYFYSLIQLLLTGLSLIFFPKYCREILPERIAGVDLLLKISERAIQKNWSVYLLGGQEEIAGNAATNLKKQYLDLKIAGAQSGPSNLNESNAEEIADLVNNINQARPDVLFVAFGAPQQDYWIQQNLPKLNTVKLAMGVGGALDFIAGKTKRAPQVYRDLGLEWLFRFWQEPWRASRIFNATVKFIYYIVKYKQLIK